MAGNDQMGMGRDRDLVLPPNTFAYVLDTTKGKVSVAVGPIKVSFSNTESPVQWDTGQKRFMEVANVAQAIQVFPMAPEGHYIVLQNPAGDGSSHPTKGISNDAADLNVGRKVNLPGPSTFALWPGQTASVIEGHHLRNNQYLIVRVYDEQQANANWQNAVVKRQVTRTQVQSSQQGGASSVTQQTDAGTDAVAQQPTEASVIAEATGERPNFTMGQLLLVKGTDVSFFVPPTGIEVVAEGNKFVREAVTLERLEYCILLNESGDKRYMQGPDVVFPLPTEKFVEADGRRKFLAIELNEQSGLYIKVIAEYTEGERTFKVGEELFITGETQAIYFPRPEHSIISYDGRQKHHAIAIPAGEGRYVLDRNKGTVDTVKGPHMFLPDPRKQVVVLRILDDRTVDLLFPGNREALAVNQNYREMSNRLSPGQHLESGALMRAAGLSPRAARAQEMEAFAGDTMSRGTQYTPPRTIVLDTKYEGAVALNIWPGFAVLVTKKTGERRVELGPKMVLLDYDETLMPLELSTGRPKDDKRLVRTAYLRVLNNQVGDIVVVETKDLVKVAVEVSYRVNFEGDNEEAREKWFSIENYVKVLADHARSRLRNAAKRHSIQEFYTNAIDITRDAILGTLPESGKRPGLLFEENNMRIYDIEVLNASIENDEVSELLIGAQTEALTGAIQLTTAEETAKRTKRIEELNRDTLDEQEKTAVKTAELAKKVIERRLLEMAEQAKVTDARLADEKHVATQRIDLAALDSRQKLEHLAGETAQMVERMKAVSPELANALTMFSDRTLVEKIITSMGPAAMVAGTTAADIFAQVFKNTPFEQVMSNLATRPLAVVEGSPRRAAN